MATINEVTYLEVTGLITLGSSPVAIYSLDTSFTRFRVATEIEERGRKRLHVIYKSYSGLRRLLETLRENGCKFREVCGPDPFPAAHSR